METVGFECYNNGTVRPSVMQIKEESFTERLAQNEYYGSFLAESRRKKGVSAAQNKREKRKESLKE